MVCFARTFATGVVVSCSTFHFYIMLSCIKAITDNVMKELHNIGIKMKPYFDISNVFNTSVSDNYVR